MAIVMFQIESIYFQFKKLQEAFEQLTAKIEEDEANKQFTTIKYEAVIEKVFRCCGDT
jgi:hypothetical protein